MFRQIMLARVKLPEGVGKRGRSLDELLVAAQALLLVRSAGSLSISEIATKAGMVQGSFYNYFDDIDALIDELGRLFVVHHGLMLKAIVRDAVQPVDVFALKTRQTLRIVTGSPAIGRLLFDAGLPVDRFIAALRDDLHADIVKGMAAGAFSFSSADLAASFVSGCLVSVSLDLHRGRIDKTAIDGATQEMLRLLGVPAGKAKAASHARVEFQPLLKLPLTWLSLANRTKKAKA
ncbi:MAG: TetR family transcriptional regulator [Alphaproteobacteria bacterium]|nr:TetR family transcriptional regulator [Alphaproteobacteria bacterium]